MEPPSKRRRVDRQIEASGAEKRQQTAGERASSLDKIGTRGEREYPKLVLPRYRRQASDYSESTLQEEEIYDKPTQSSEEETSRVQIRQVIPANDASVTMLAIAVTDGQGNVSEIVVPMASQTVSIPGYGELTMTNLGPSATMGSPGAVTPPAAVAAASARVQALQTQEAIAKQLDTVPQAPTSQSQMNIQVPESRSEQLLSSPPTPVPTTPKSSSGSEYFPSSSANALTPSPLPATPPTVSQSPNGVQPGSSNNSTTSSTTTPITSSTPLKLSVMTALTTPFEASVSTSNFSMTSTLKSSSSFTPLTLGSSSSFTSSAPSTFTTSTSSQSSSSSSTSSTGFGAGGIGSPSNSVSPPSPSSSSNTGSGNNNTPSTPVLVGAIVGSVAGFAMILFLLLLLLRWRRTRSRQPRTISPPTVQELGPGGVMTQRSSNVPIAAAGFFGRLTRPQSSQTATTAETAPSEKGFQKLGGRKIPSVLTSGGDGYGDSSAAAGASGSAGPSGPTTAHGQAPIGAAIVAPALRPSPSHSLSGSSFYRDSQGFYGGHGPEASEGGTSGSPTGSPNSSSPTYPSPLAIAGRGSPAGRREEIPNMRPGPARTPVINQPGFAPMRTPSRPSQPPRPVRATPPPGLENPFRDGLGRSHPSQDGSRGSRFREDTTPP